MAKAKPDLRDEPGVAAGREPIGDADPDLPFSVLLVCTGNVSRSPTAQILFDTAVNGEGAPRVDSAGTRATAGNSIDPEMLKRLDGATPHDRPFASKPVSRELVMSADLILGMTREHRAAAVRLSPPAVRSAFTLEEFAWLIESDPDVDDSVGPTVRLRAAVRSAERRRVLFRLGADRHDDISDPIGQSRAVYDQTFDRISRAVGAITTFAAGPAR